MASERLPRRLHAQHFAYLRAFVEGIDGAHAARLYLGIDDGRRARTLHRSMLGDLRALAKCLGDARWRLLGVSLPPKVMPGPQPSLDEWTSAQGLDDWSQAERLEMYQEAFPTDGPNRKGRRNERVRRRQLELLKILEPMASQAVQPDHPVDAWLPEDGPKLAAVGLQTMGQLAEAIASGRKWWRAIPSFGPTKAQRIVDQLQFLYPNAMTSIRQGGLVEIRHAFLPDPNRRDLDGSRGANRAPDSRALMP